MARERTSIWPIGSDYEVAVSLLDWAGDALAAGTVSGQLYDDRDAEVGSAVSFTYDAASGKWQGQLTDTDTADLIDGVSYYMLITSTDGSGNVVKTKIVKDAGYIEVDE